MESCDPVGTLMEIKDKLNLDQNGTPVDATKYHSMIGALMYLTSSRPYIVHATCLCARYQAKPTEKHLKEVKRIFRYLRGTINMGLELTGFSDADYARCKDTFKSTFGRAQFLGEKLEYVEKVTIKLYFVKTDYQLADIFTKALPADRFNYLVRRLGMHSLSPKELDLLAKSQSGGIYPGTLPLDRVEVLGMLTRSMADKLTIDSASECLFADFLYKIELKKVYGALKHPWWVDAMQEEPNRFYRNKEEGIDYDETFAPVTRIEAIKIFLAFATYMNFIVYQMDVKSAFLNGKLKEKVYVKQPPSFESSEFPDYVYKLEKALYGLKQAPRAWYETRVKENKENDKIGSKPDKIESKWEALKSPD
nr:retrovirus-related Pol polyprotein from transposon TNT 1-94 [Tanacetum cinerariifolium]